MSKSLWIFGVIFGALFMAAGIFMLASTIHLIRSGVKSTGLIVGIEEIGRRRTGYAPIIEFVTPDGQTHRFTSKMSSNSKPSIGSKKAILYNSEYPEDAVVNSTFELWVFPGIFIGSGMLSILLIGVLPIVSSLRNKRRARRLKSTGLPILMNVTGVTPTSYKINRKPLYRIHLQQERDGVAASRYLSSLLWFDPTEQVKGTRMTVYQNPIRPDDYWVDTDSLVDPTKQRK